MTTTLSVCVHHQQFDTGCLQAWSCYRSVGSAWYNHSWCDRFCGLNLRAWFELSFHTMERDDFLFRCKFIDQTAVWRIFTSTSWSHHMWLTNRWLRINVALISDWAAVLLVFGALLCHRSSSHNFYNIKLTEHTCLLDVNTCVPLHLWTKWTSTLYQLKERTQLG